MENTANSEKLTQLKNQIEYYLSDENLKRDQFFHEKISESTNGFLDFDFLLNCNKIKKLEVNKEDLAQAVKRSDVLELDETTTKVRRKDNKPLPELQLLNKKRQKDKTSEEEKPRETSSEKFDPVVLIVKSDKEVERKWKSIQDEFRSLNPHIEVVYARFKNTEGHFVVLKRPHQELKFTENFEFEGINFTVKKCEGDELIDFWKEHGSHYEMCTSRNKRMNKKDNKNSTNLKEPIKLGDEVYTDLSKIRSKARNILSSSKDEEKLSKDDESFLKDLLKHHRNGEEKLKDMSYITTGKPSEFNYSRCFFVVKSDGSKEDFSVGKCLVRLENETKRK